MKFYRCDEMNLYEILFELAPDMIAIYELGFIPEEDEIHELSPELYPHTKKRVETFQNASIILFQRPKQNVLPPMGSTC